MTVKINTTVKVEGRALTLNDLRTLTIQTEAWPGDRPITIHAYRGDRPGESDHYGISVTNEGNPTP